MKRFGNLYEKIYDIENIRMAHHKARLGKAHYSDVRMVNSNEDYYCQKIHEMLKNETYEVDLSKYIYMKIIDKGKERDIYKLPYYPHRIIQWAIMLQLEPIFKKMFIHDTYASIKGRGIHDAVVRINRAMRDKDATKYCLKIDVKKYYPSINNHILYNLLKRKFKDPKLLRLLKKIVFSMGDKGQPIGSLWSQYAGNFYLSKFDHWLKEEKGVKYNWRYCDDMVILHHNKEYLQLLLIEIKEYLKNNLDLNLKKNFQVFPSTTRGIDFLGYRFFGDYVLLRKRTVKKMKKQLVQYRMKEFLSYNESCSVMSYLGWILPCNSYRLKEKYFKPLNDKLYFDFKGDLQVLKIL